MATVSYHVNNVWRYPLPNLHVKQKIDKLFAGPFADLIYFQKATMLIFLKTNKYRYRLYQNFKMS